MDKIGKDIMKICLLANIGSRDLQLDGQGIKPPRVEGEKIKNNFESFRKRLTTPILTPVIEHIVKVKAYSNSPLDIILFCTNQVNAPEEYKNNDTIFFAEIIKEMFAGGRKLGVRKVKCQEITSNPNLYDTMFQFFQKSLTNLQNRFSDYDRIFSSLAGGIPACNMAMCFHSISIFQERCIPVYVLEGSKEAVFLQVGKQLLDNFRKNLIKDRLKNYDYGIVVPLLGEIGRPDLAKLAEVASHRLNFDFDKAKAFAEEIINNNMGEIRDLCLLFKSDFQELSNKRMEALINELCYNARIKWDKCEYLDFLGRIHRFSEAVLRYLLERGDILGITTAIDADGKFFNNYLKSISKIPGLEDFLEKQTYESQKLNYKQPYVPALLAILNFAIQKSEDEKKNRLTFISNRIKELQKFSSLRNKSPLGHDFEGVSLDRIRAAIPGFEFKYLQEIGEKLEMNEGKNPFERVNQFILSQIKV